MAVNIRRMERRDFDQVHELLGQMTSCPPVSEEDVERYFAGHDSRSDWLQIFVVADSADDKLVVGCGTLLVEPKIIHSLGLVGHIEDVVIHKSAREKGYGQMLVKHLMSTADNLGCYKVTLDCGLMNVEFYQKCGMLPRGTQMAKYF